MPSICLRVGRASGVCIAQSAVRWVLPVVLIAASWLPAMAQDLRIYTTVTDTLAGTSSAPHRSLTLFHAGKVYDFLTGTDEVIIFEPAERTFTLIDLSRKLTTTITQDQVRHFLSLAETEADKTIRELERQSSTAKQRSAELLRFQLNPDFEVAADGNSLLRLRSSTINYSVQAVAAPSEEAAEVYYRYADWIAQLNAILHPSFLPKPRLAVNDELRSRNWLPVQVELTVAGQPPIARRASHELAWKLQQLDREHIHQWETLLAEGKLKSVPFRDFQVQQLSASRK